MSTNVHKSTRGSVLLIGVACLAAKWLVLVGLSFRVFKESEVVRTTARVVIVERGHGGERGKEVQRSLRCSEGVAGA